MTAQTTTQRTAAHRRRMAEKMARLVGALKEIANMSGEEVALDPIKPLEIARKALNPTSDAE